MIGIKLAGDNEFLELPPDARISLKLENPLLIEDDRISPGSYSFPFNVPGGKVSPGNAAKLNLPQVIENNTAYQVLKADLYYKGVPFKTGTLKSKSATKDIIDSHFLYGLSQISPQFKTARLRDVISEEIIIDASPVTKKIYLKRKIAGNYNVTINGVSYNSTTITALKDAVNAAAAGSLDSGKYVPFGTLITTGTSPSGLITATFLELKPVRYITITGTPTYQDSTDPLHELFVKANEGPENYQCESFDMSTYYAAFDTFISGYQTGSPYPNNKVRFPVRFNATPYDDILKDTDYINMPDPADFSGLHRNDPNFGIIQYDEPFHIINSNSLQPFVLLKHVIDKIATYFGFSLEGDFYEDSAMATVLLDTTATLDYPQNYMGEKKFIFWRRSFNINELVPDWSVVEFLSALQSRYNIGIYVNEITKKVRLVRREPIAKSYTYDDITSISSPVDINEDDRITGVMLKLLKEETDALSVQESVSIGVPEETVEVKIGRLFQTKFAYVGGVAVVGPVVSQKFNVKAGLRVFYYKGIVTSGIRTYSACDIQPPAEGWDLTTIYNSFWKYWIYFRIRRRVVKLKVSWPFRRLRMFDWEMKRRFDRNNYLVKSIDVTLENNHVGESIVELYKF